MQNPAASGVVFGFVGLSARPGTRDPGSARFRPLQYASCPFLFLCFLLCSAVPMSSSCCLYKYYMVELVSFIKPFRRFRIPSLTRDIPSVKTDPDAGQIASSPLACNPASTATFLYYPLQRQSWLSLFLRRTIRFLSLSVLTSSLRLVAPRTTLLRPSPRVVHVHDVLLTFMLVLCRAHSTITFRYSCDEMNPPLSKDNTSSSMSTSFGDIFLIIRRGELRLCVDSDILVPVYLHISKITPRLFYLF